MTNIKKIKKEIIENLKKEIQIVKDNLRKENKNKNVSDFLFYFNNKLSDEDCRKLFLIEYTARLETAQKISKLKDEEFSEFKKRFFDKFDEYSCIKNDEWYLKFKEEELKLNIQSQDGSIGNDELDMLPEKSAKVPYEHPADTQIKGCGKEACGVTIKDENGMDDVDITLCGDFCPYHKKIEFCPECQAKQEMGK